MALEPITRQEKIIAGQDLTPITRMEKFLKEFGGSGGGGGAQPDWNAAEGKPGHILNRPFYESTDVLFDQGVEISDDELKKHWAMEQALPISSGDSVSVTFNGVKYELTAQPVPGFPDLVYFGNDATFGGPDNGIPFCVMTGSDGNGEFTAISAPDYAGQFVSVKVEALVVKTLDPKFIPAGVGGGVVIVQDSAMASGVAVASQAPATATMNAAEIAEAIFAGKTVYFLEPNDGTLLPFVYGYRFGELASGVMTLGAAPDHFALFGALDSDGYYHRITVYSDGVYYMDGFSVGS